MKHINGILNKDINALTNEEAGTVVKALLTRIEIEHKKGGRSGIFARTQTDMAYNSNKIEGSTLTPSQTNSLYNTGTIRAEGDEVYRAKDIEEIFY